MTKHKKTENDNRQLSGTFSKTKTIINMLKKVNDKMNFNRVIHLKKSNRNSAIQ